MINRKRFQEYLSSLNHNVKLHGNFLGIVKKDFPKWEGWSIIAKHKSAGVKVQDIVDSTLDCLVVNHYYLEFIKYTYKCML